MLGTGADLSRPIVDAEAGILLRSQAEFEGHVFRTIQVDDIVLMTDSAQACSIKQRPTSRSDSVLPNEIPREGAWCAADKVATRSA